MPSRCPRRIGRCASRGAGTGSGTRGPSRRPGAPPGPGPRPCRSGRSFLAWAAGSRPRGTARPARTPAQARAGTRQRRCRFSDPAARPRCPQRKYRTCSLLVPGSSGGDGGERGGELVTPGAWGHVMAHGPLGVLEEPAAPAVLDLEPRRSGHVERRHAVIGVLADGHLDLVATFGGEVQCQAHCLKASHLEHEMPETDRQTRDRGHRDRMVTGVAVHEGPFGDAEVDRVAEPEPQAIGVELDHLVRRVTEQERVPDAQVTGDELESPGRDERAAVDLLPVERLELMTVNVGENDEAANLTVPGQLVICSHVDPHGRERLSQLAQRGRALYLESERHQGRWSARGSGLDCDPPGPLIGAQPDLIGRMTCDLSPQQVGTEALPLFDRTLNNYVGQRADSAHDGVLSSVSTE